jgi:hypothetical protein
MFASMNNIQHLKYGYNMVMLMMTYKFSNPDENMEPALVFIFPSEAATLK